MGRKRIGLVWLSTMAIGLVTGCTTTPPATVGQDTSARDAQPTVADPQIKPSWEPPSKTGNPESYKVFGKRYYVMDSSQGYRERGKASWYGKDFHGKKTSSGVPYDMYAMTAAHKSLPIPTYVRVKNLENGRNIVVKVNDRGPFVHGRIIDLSYTAASRLGMIKDGTAPVEVVALAPYQYLSGAMKPKTAIAATYQNASSNTQRAESPTLAMTAAAPAQPQVSAVPPVSPPPPLNAAPVATNSPIATTPYASPAVFADPIYVQLGAFSLRHNAEHLQRQVAPHITQDVHVHSDSDKLYKVRIGPLQNAAEVQRLVTQLADLGITVHKVASR